MKRRGKYITLDILLACLSTPPGMKKDIHARLEETIAERKRIIQRWESSFLPNPRETKNDIHAQLAETIAERKRIIQQWESSFPSKPAGTKKGLPASPEATIPGNQKSGKTWESVFPPEPNNNNLIPGKKAAWKQLFQAVLSR